ncbi:DnaT-like ssDNA-binding protein [Methylobacterium sp. CM6247]
MPLIIGTNAYVALDEADAYFSECLNSSGWEAASSQHRVNALLAATASLDRLGFNGMIASREQRLAWPRIRVRDREGRIPSPDAVPDAVKAATCEFALHLLTKPSATEPAPAVSQKRVGDLQISYRAASPDPVPFAVRQHLAPFLSDSAHSLEVVL